MPTASSESSNPQSNLFLARLHLADYDAVLRNSKIVRLKLGQRVIRQDERVESVYFPLTCMFSLLVTSGDEPRMEMATIGKEGVIGASEALQHKAAIGLKLVQKTGEGAPSWGGG